MWSEDGAPKRKPRSQTAVLVGDSGSGCVVRSMVWKSKFLSPTTALAVWSAASQHKNAAMGRMMGVRMEEVFLWKIPDDYPENLIGTYERDISPDRFIFLQGKEIPIDGPRPVLSFDAPVGVLEEFADLANNALVPLVSSEVASILQRHCPHDIQLIDAQVLASDKNLPGYRIVNATHTVRSINHEKSDYSIVPGTNEIMGFRKLVCLPGCLGSHAIARDGEYLSNLLICRGLRDLLSGAKGLGMFGPAEMS